MEEKRGPIEKGEKGWPINPFGVVALLIFGIIIIFLIVRPLLSQKTPQLPLEQTVSPGGKILKPQAGDIIKEQRLKIELSVDDPSSVDKIQFWAKTYADGKWQTIGEVTKEPFVLDWQIPVNFQNKAIAITSHIFNKGGTIVKDPGGWREGIILLNQ